MEKILKAYNSNLSSTEFTRIFAIKLSAKLFILANIMEALNSTELKIPIVKNVAVKYLKADQYIFCDDNDNVCVKAVDLIELRSNIFNDIVSALMIMVKEDNNEKLMEICVLIVEFLKNTYFINDYEKIKLISKEIIK